MANFEHAYTMVRMLGTRRKYIVASELYIYLEREVPPDTDIWRSELKIIHTFLVRALA